MENSLIMNQYVYTLYRKTNINDGSHEPTDHLMSTLDLKKIFTVDNYNHLANFEDFWFGQDEDSVSDRSESLFFYFVLKFKLDTMNERVRDLGEVFYDPQKNLNKDEAVFSGSLKLFKEKVDSMVNQVVDSSSVKVNLSPNTYVSWEEYKDLDENDEDELKNYQQDVLAYWKKNGREGFNPKFDKIFKEGCTWGDDFEAAVENGDIDLATRIYEEFNKRHVDIRGPIWSGDHMYISFDLLIERLFGADDLEMEDLNRFELLDLLFKISGLDVMHYKYTENLDTIFTEYIRFLENGLEQELHDPEQGPQELKPKHQDQKDPEQEPKSKLESKPKHQDQKGPKPRKPDTAYVYFVKNNINKIRSEYPDLKFGQITKTMMEAWKKLSNKEPYIQKAKIDRERYERELAEYNNCDCGSCSDSDIVSDNDSDSNCGVVKEQDLKEQDLKDKDPISEKDFVENNEVIKYVEGILEKEYPKDSIPGWVNYDLFKEDLLENMLKELYFNLGEKWEYDSNNTYTNWNCILHMGFVSQSLKHDDLFDVCDRYETVVPKNIIKIFYGQV
jgi:hypothetical protein